MQTKKLLKLKKVPLQKYSVNQTENCSVRDDPVYFLLSAVG